MPRQAERAALERVAGSLRDVVAEFVELLNLERAPEARRFNWALRTREVARVLAVVEREAGRTADADDPRAAERELLARVAVADGLLEARRTGAALDAAALLRAHGRARERAERRLAVALERVSETTAERDRLLAAWSIVRRAERRAWRRSRAS